MAPTTRSKAAKAKKKVEVDNASDSDLDIEEEGWTVANIMKARKRLGNYWLGREMLTDPDFTWLIATVLFIAEIFINSFIVLTKTCRFIN